MNILLVDDEKLIREGMRLIVSGFSGMQVAGTAADGEEALEFIRQNPVDVILMDLRMPNMDGVEATRRILKEDPAIAILILTTFHDTESIEEAMRYGARGYLLKDSEASSIEQAIRASLQGNVVLHPLVANHMLEKSPVTVDADLQAFDLKDKELELIREVAEGYTNQEIADRLHLSPGTIKNQVSMLLSKLGLRDRTQLAIFAYRNKISR